MERKKSPPPKIVEISNVPEEFQFLKCNPFVSSGYRINFGWFDTFKSLFQFHNETVNTLTHVFGALVFLALILQTALWFGGNEKCVNSLYKMGIGVHSGLAPLQSFPHKNFQEAFRSGAKDVLRAGKHTFSEISHDVVALTSVAVNALNQMVPHLTRWPLLVFLTSAVLCLSFSWVFHLFGCVSNDTYQVLAKLDYTGIAVLIAGSSFPIMIYGFHCHPIRAIIYLAVLSTLCLSAVGMALIPRFSSNEWRIVRMSVFLGCGLFGILPATDLFLSIGFSTPAMKHVSWKLISMGILYVSGAVMYGLQFPERLFPSRNLHFPNSHHIFHICVVLAALTHWDGVLSQYSYRTLNQEC